MTKFKLVLPSLATALSLSAAMLLCGCAEAEISYPLSAYTNHPVGDAIAQYLSEQDALTFPDEDMEEALSQFGVEVVSAETLRERLGDEAEAVLGEHCTYLYTEREFTTHGDTLLSPAVYVISADENRYFTQAFTPENPGGARWDSYYVSVHDILSRQYLPAEDGGYDCIALSDFAFVRVYCTDHYIFPAGHRNMRLTSMTPSPPCSKTSVSEKICGCKRRRSSSAAWRSAPSLSRAAENDRKKIASSAKNLQFYYNFVRIFLHLFATMDADGRVRRPSARSATAPCTSSSRRGGPRMKAAAPPRCLGASSQRRSHFAWARSFLYMRRPFLAISGDFSIKVLTNPPESITI